MRRCQTIGLPTAPAHHGDASNANALAPGITGTSDPDPAQLQSMGVNTWPTWSCGLIRPPWRSDEQETWLLLQGEVTVPPDGGEPVRFGAGDLVVFNAGLRCS